MRQPARMLRTWRARLAPGQAGLPAHADRRTPGLRREELAVLAGVSIDYVVRLEQGRASAPSAQVCVALARALRLSDVDRPTCSSWPATPSAGDGSAGWSRPASAG